MGKLGFYCFTSPTPPVVLTLKQQVKALSDDQRAALIIGFRTMIPAAHLDHRMGLSQGIIQYVYDGIDAIQESCRSHMRGEVVVTPAVLDANGNVITPAVYNTPPTTQVMLRTTVSPLFLEDYPQLFVTNVIQEMVDWCKYDGTGNFTFYKNNIIL
jgi:hypothetical protein